MWYFTWILGVMLASSFAIINVMWLEVNNKIDNEETDSEIS
jgi:cyd operon protein YbgT